MKKTMCILLLVLIALGSNCFTNKRFEDVIDIEHVYSIKAIIDDNPCEFQGVFNGNKKVVDIANFQQLHGLTCDGITIILHKEHFNLLKFIDNLNLIIVNNYKINDNKVYDCKSVKYSLYGYSTMQIVERKTDVVIGVPIILNDF